MENGHRLFALWLSELRRVALQTVCFRFQLGSGFEKRRLQVGGINRVREGTSVRSCATRSDIFGKSLCFGITTAAEATFHSQEQNDARVSYVPTAVYFELV